MISNWLPKPYRAYLSLGSEIAVSLALPIILGSLADGYFGIEPFGTISGVLVGVILFFFRIVRLLRDPALDIQEYKPGDEKKNEQEDEPLK